jgi:hypothetical protein
VVPVVARLIVAQQVPVFLVKEIMAVRLVLVEMLFLAVAGVVLEQLD